MKSITLHLFAHYRNLAVTELSFMPASEISHQDLPMQISCIRVSSTISPGAILLSILYALYVGDLMDSSRRSRITIDFMLSGAKRVTILPCEEK